MKTSDLVDGLRHMANMMEALQTLTRRIDSVRRADETTGQTLERVLKERAEIVVLLKKGGIVCNDFDFEFKDYGMLADRVEELIEQTVKAPLRAVMQLLPVDQRESLVTRLRSPNFEPRITAEERTLLANLVEEAATCTSES